ncbi:uncharacterized protein LOC100876146 isoform X2 [Megachile rotundata]|nr:PREDICTED: uncharacterized protein LOC100876146 isoform X2 [Megachile rotundata]XP_012151525.1 PREDICTED: uncharacterized protein LOC100876146 isoform X2 [Megachile rotundata]XP_012151526.1 PREDICTED: uncharacterized protein LOC100876146 isoform X2 [Megachile rotundata]XP_012151527.1 PREDICTED: uncharacterized protein LOC100876146 isoform X2 [Megachile rotundata]
MLGLDSVSRQIRSVCQPTTMLILFILSLGDIPSINGSCEFPSAWTGEWFQYGKPVTISVNTTVLGERTCVERSEQSYIVYGDNCYHCIIVNDRHENVIQFREGWCQQDHTNLEEMCMNIKSDDTLYSMFRVNSKPIPCPFSGPSFTFTYDKGYGECSMPISLGEKCTDESKLLLKYQACPDVERSESNTEELQCLAIWNDGRNKYLVGTLKGRSVSGAEKTYRCFLYEEKTHHQGKVVYLLAQSGEPTCNGLTTVSEGSPTIKLTKVDKEHNRCKYPSWITEHHDWHSLDGTKVYHFTNKNATLKIKVQNSEEDAFHEEKIVCHNLEKLHPTDNAQGYKVKLIAHVTSGCDIGYVCMIFHKRDHHVIELQQSDQKAIMPDDACSLVDTSTMPYTTLISSSLRQRKCPNPGRYMILGFAPFHLPNASFRQQQRRSEKRSSRITKRRTWHDDATRKESREHQPLQREHEREHPHEHDQQHHHHHHHRQHGGELQQSQYGEQCRSSSVRIGCASSDQSEIVVGKTCDSEETAYYCHGSWEEKGTWYTIASLKTDQTLPGPGQTFCFSMRRDDTEGKSSVTGKTVRTKHPEQELWFARFDRVCRTEQTEDGRTYTLVDQGVCEDVTKAASSLASLFSLSRILFLGTVGNCAAVYMLLFR